VLNDDALQAEGLYRRLLQSYGAQGWWPLLSRAGETGYDEEGYHPGRYDPPESRDERFEIGLGAILTQNTSWSNVRHALRNLHASDLLRPEAVAAASRERIAEQIRPSGYYRQKARKLEIFTRFFCELEKGAAGPEPSSCNGPAADNGRRGGGRVPPAPERRQLLALWGIGPETADSILLYAYGRPFFVIDAYTRRLAGRLTGEREAATRMPYAQLQELFAAGASASASAGASASASAGASGGEYDRKSGGEASRESGGEPDGLIYRNELHALIVAHGKERCTARSPHCSGCPLRSNCIYGRRGGL
jgi:endonuclease-3 related protein